MGHTLQFDGSYDPAAHLLSWAAVLLENNVVLYNWGGSYHHGELSSTLAEWLALRYGLRLALTDFELDALTIQGDFKMIIDSLNGRSRPRTIQIKTILTECLDLLESVNWVAIHIPRSQNILAHNKAKSARLISQAWHKPTKSKPTRGWRRWPD